MSGVIGSITIEQQQQRLVVFSRDQDTSKRALPADLRDLGVECT